MAAPLATVTDIENRLGRTLDASESARATALIGDAGVKVRNYTRQDFDHVIGDEVTLRPVADVLRLPQRPVLNVTQVASVGPDGQVVSVLTGWAWDGSDKVRITGHGIAGILDPWWPWSGGPSSFRVTYDHGYPDIPEVVVAVVCSMVIRVFESPSAAEGMIGERIGTYSYQMQQGSGSAGATVRLTSADKSELDLYRRKASTVAVR